MMNNTLKKIDRPIPLSVAKRLPVYYRYLTGLMQREIERISSQELADKLGVTASQIRQDLSHFGSFGRRGYGYRVKELQESIAYILGINRTKNMVLVGAGNLGRAIANYSSFREKGFFIKAVFDNDLEKIGTVLADCEIKSIDLLEEYLYSNNIDIGIIAIPVENAAAIVEIFEKGGVKGIWNFAPISINSRSNIIVENVHISESLLTLSYRIFSRNK